MRFLSFVSLFSSNKVQLKTYVKYTSVYFSTGNDEKLLALPAKCESLLSQPCNSREVVLQLKNCLQLDQASLKHPDPGTKRLIRCVAIKAKRLNRLDVFDHLREITPAGTTGKLVVTLLPVIAQSE